MHATWFIYGCFMHRGVAVILRRRAELHVYLFYTSPIYSYSSWAGGTPWYTWHIWYNDPVIWKIGVSFALIDIENIHRILIRVVGWRDSLYATHTALAFCTFPILSTLPWYSFAIFTPSILSARVVRFPHTRLAALYDSHLIQLFNI